MMAPGNIPGNDCSLPLCDWFRHRVYALFPRAIGRQACWGVSSGALHGLLGSFLRYNAKPSEAGPAANKLLQRAGGGRITFARAEGDTPSPPLEGHLTQQSPIAAPQ
eukprot:9252857-Pyramimonas_sp.AAC.1